jgi:saccharopine dehydrogenase (NAD+, L-lysine forming)
VGEAGADEAPPEPRRKESRIMKVLLVGTGTVGEAIAALSRGRPWLEKMVLADYDLERALQVHAKVGHDPAYVAVRVDASRKSELVELIRAHGIDLVMNAVDPRFVMPIFEAALEAGAHYVDMAVSLSEPHPTDPFNTPGVMLGDRQFAMADAWKASGRMALLGIGMDPGLSDLFGKYAAKHLFDEVHGVHVRDGGDMYIEGYAFAPVFSIWTTIEECLNPPLLWERERGWYTTEPFSGAERFIFPEGIGPVECVNVEHEEVVLAPRGLDIRSASFKYALGDEFIDVLRTLHKLGLDSTKKVRVRGVEVAPRDVVAAVTPDPMTVGDRMIGRAIVGTWVTGLKDGRPREVFLYQMADGQEVWRTHGLQVVGWQTGFNPVLAMELIAEGAWSAEGIVIPEQMDPDPYLDLMDHLGIHHAMMEIEPGTAIA